jgi:hypothetical protein
MHRLRNGHIKEYLKKLGFFFECKARCFREAQLAQAVNGHRRKCRNAAMGQAMGQKDHF